MFQCLFDEFINFNIYCESSLVCLCTILHFKAKQATRYYCIIKHDMHKKEDFFGFITDVMSLKHSHN